VDGANLGFSLTKDYEVRCQNRAHFVTSESHAQWRSLDAWLEEVGAQFPTPNTGP
jgi:atypical dual specificity phosphatase